MPSNVEFFCLACCYTFGWDWWRIDKRENKKKKREKVSLFYHLIFVFFKSVASGKVFLCCEGVCHFDKWCSKNSFLGFLKFYSNEDFNLQSMETFFLRSVTIKTFFLFFFFIYFPWSLQLFSFLTKQTFSLNNWHRLVRWAENEKSEGDTLKNFSSQMCIKQPPSIFVIIIIVVNSELEIEKLNDEGWLLHL